MDFVMSGRKVLKNYQGEGGHVVIPAGVTEIADCAFDGCRNIDTIEFPAGLTKIGRWAFQFCSVTEVILPDSVEKMGHSCFFQCDRLVKVKLPSHLKKIPEYAFQQCSQLSLVEIPASVEVIEESAFCLCKRLEKVVLHEGLTEIGFTAFAGCTELKDITIPASVTEIAARAFENCSLLTEEQTTTRRIAFYTVVGAKTENSITVGGRHIAQVGYDDEDVARIIEEAEQYEIHCESEAERCGWYTDDRVERSTSTTVRKVTPENLLVKGGHFYGCVLEYRHSYWSYHTTDDRSSLVLLTVDGESGVQIAYTDHSTDNGDHTSSTYAYLVRKQ